MSDTGPPGTRRFSSRPSHDDILNSLMRCWRWDDEDDDSAARRPVDDPRAQSAVIHETFHSTPAVATLLLTTSLVLRWQSIRNPRKSSNLYDNTSSSSHYAINLVTTMSGSRKSNECLDVYFIKRKTKTSSLSSYTSTSHDSQSTSDYREACSTQTTFDPATRRAGKVSSTVTVLMSDTEHNVTQHSI